MQPSRSEIAANIASGNIPDVLVDGIAIAMSGKGLMCWFRTMHHGLTALQHGKRPPTAAALQRDLAAFLLSAEARSVRNSACGELLGMVLQRDGSSLEQLAESTRRGGVAGMGGSDLAVAACHLYSVNYFVYVREGRRFRRLSSGTQLTTQHPSMGDIHVAYTAVSLNHATATPATPAAAHATQLPMLPMLP